MRTVRDATLDVLRHAGLSTIFANPGSTEIPLLADLPEDFRFVLALHEGSVVGMATGWAIAAQRPGLVLLHTAAGLGNAVGALATARVNRAPLVVLVGQQDRRHLTAQPFLAGQLDGMAGEYPVWVGNPPRAADVPSTVARAWHEARLGRGPALVIVPMNDWDDPADALERVAAPLSVHLSEGFDERACAALTAQIDAAADPVLVVGARADDPEVWRALTLLAGRLGCPVWQEPFGARAGFPQNSAHFAGHLPAGRAALRETLDGHDLVLVVGAPALRQFGYEPGPLFAAGTRVVVVTDDPGETVHSAADLAVVAPLAPLCDALANRVRERTRDPRVAARPRASEPPADQPLSPAGVFAMLGARLPADTVLLEESPSSRQLLQDLVPARSPLGFLSAAMGGLGFAVPAAAGIKMARPDRPVVAVVGDGSSLYAIHALWSAQRYGAGVLYIVLANGGYAVMDQLAARHGGKAPWPGFDDVNVSGLAAALGCAARRVHRAGELAQVLDEVVPGLADRPEPLLLEVLLSR
jgi:benzoylformate decarboxylase